MTDAGTDNPLDDHATQIHEGFAHEDTDFEADRARRTELVKRFLTAMEDAGRPGVSRKFGSTMLQLTGQKAEYYWATGLTDDAGHEREVLVFDSGTHGWSDEITYSDRPRTPADEITSHHLERALGQIAKEHGVAWPADAS